MSTVHGLIPILATPFTADGELDFESMRRLVRFQLASGADGLGMFGMASEAFALTDDERDELLRLVDAEVDQQVPLIVGAGGTAVRPALAQARRAADLGASALMVMAPHLVKPSPEQLVDFFGSLAAGTGLPVMVQDAPAVTGVALPPALMARICASPGVDHIKVETQPTAQVVGEMITAVEGQASVLGGQNALFLLEEYARGAVGTMPACEMTDVLRSCVDAIDQGDRATATSTFNRLLPLLRYGLQPGIAWTVHKYVLVARGIIASPTVRAPAREADRPSLEGLDAILADLRLPHMDDALAGR